MSMEDSIILVYCLAEGMLKLFVQKNLRQSCLEPSLYDSEVITMDIFGKYAGIDTYKGIWEYFFLIAYFTESER